MHHFFFLLGLLLLLPLSPPVYAEAIPTPPPVERPKTKQRLGKAYKKRLMRHPSRTQAAKATTLTIVLFAFIALFVLGIVGAIWGFFVFAGLGPTVLLLTNLVLDVGWIILLYHAFRNGFYGFLLTIAVFPFFWLGLKTFSLGLLLGLAGLWIPGLVVLSLAVLVLLLLLVVLLFGT